MLLTCAAALAPSVLPIRVVVAPQGNGKNSKQVLKVLDMRTADARRLIEMQDFQEPSSQSPYAIRPSRSLWPYSQLPADPKPSDIRTDKGRYWLIQRP
ncbi:MAG TPA: hypothetical protein VG820_07680 [Fimbriimonadaceae bacterium]|nr:hypothetical protein [Fimbriimonadaceae bacterium]